MKIAVLIPDRGDRPNFLRNCERMIENQTLKPTYMFVVDYPPKNDDCDITQRYRVGYESINKYDVDCILLMENDDYYSQSYIETMVNNWIKNGKPDIFGTDYTIYYHINERAHFTMNHSRRSSAMSTLIKPNLNIQWPKDNDPYTDIALWKQLKGITFRPDEIICIGIKHGVGKCGGKNHTCNMHRYINKDSNFEFLKQNMDSESFNFYTNEIFQN
jgi:hypothetical protein